MNFVPLHVHSDFSLLDGAMNAERIVERCKELGYKACAITDHGSSSGFYEFWEECNKHKIKPILGVEAYVCRMESDLLAKENRKLDHLPILCKNLAGVKAMYKAVSQSNRRFYHKPRLTLEEWGSYANGNWIVFSGHPGSTLFNAIVRDDKLVDDAEQKAIECIERHQFLFGKENFFVEIQLVDIENLPFMTEVAEVLRKAAKRMGAERIATGDSHYATKEDAEDQRLLLCAAIKTTLPKIRASLDSDDAKDVCMAGFFKSDNYHIPSFEEMAELHKGYEEELTNCVKIADLCEEYSLKNKPILPTFDPEIDAYNEVVARCRVGWKELIDIPKEDKRYQVYVDRIKMELDVIKNNNLSNYFLIVADICDFARKSDILMGPGRGSAAGCMISYLLGITQVDPIKYNLLFERFFNEARKDAIPDIDLDFQPSKREMIFDYIKSKYSADKIAKIATFGRLQGRGALKTVLTVHEACSVSTMNDMTKFVPDEAAIADDLQAMGEDDHENAKILYWAVVNNAKELAPWVKLEPDGSYSGEFGKYFEQAIRLEGLYRHIGEHASGIIITPTDIDDYCPLVMSNKKKLLAAMPYPHLEGGGLPKFDILGTSVLDKLKMIMNAMETGDLYGDENGDSLEDQSSYSGEETEIDDDEFRDSGEALQDSDRADIIEQGTLFALR